MRKWALNLLAGLLLLACMAMILIWSRSYWRVSRAFLYRTHYLPGGFADGPQEHLCLARGGLAFRHRAIVYSNWGTSPQLADPPWQWNFWERPAPAYPRPAAGWPGHSTAPRMLQWLGFDWGRGRGGGAGYDEVQTAVVVPCWFLFLLMLMPTAIVCRARYRLGEKRRRARMGLCLSCGYDLRASSERCPECGTPTPPRKPGNSRPPRY